MKSSNTSEMSIYPESRNGSEGGSIKSIKSIRKSISEVMGFKSKSEKKIKPQEEQDIESDNDANKESEDKSTRTSNDENNWWKESVTEYAFNLPPVRKNLDRLICTDIVQLTDHKFMSDLRNRVWDDFDERLTEKVKQRQFLEIERTKKLILKCSYNINNCPRKLIPLHTAVLALDFVSAETTSKRAKDTLRSNEYDGPVFNINRKTNATVSARRMKLKSIRRRNFDYLMRQLRKQGNAIKLEYDQLMEIQENMKNIRNSIMEKKANNSKYLKYVTNVVKKLKSIITPKNRTNEKPLHKQPDTTMDVFAEQTKSKVKTNPKLFKNSKGKTTSKRSKSSKLNSIKSEAPKESKTILITKDSRKLKRSQSTVSFQKSE